MKKIISLVIAIFMVLGILLYNGNIYAIDLSENKMKLPSEEIQIKEDMAIKKYNTLMAKWTKSSVCVSDIDGDYPEFFGGAFIDDDKNLVIQTTYLNDDVKEYLSSIISLDNVLFENVDKTYAELLELHDIIVNMIYEDEYYRTVISGVGINVKSNSIAIFFQDELIPYVYESVKALTNSEDVITVNEYSGKCELTAYATLGNRIDIGNGYRSIGFWATTNNGYLGIVSAGHELATYGYSVYVGNDYFGQSGYPYYSNGADAVFILRTNTAFQPSNYVPDWYFQLESNTVTLLPVGSTIYSRGCSSGAQSGTVTTVNYTNPYFNLTNCILTNATSISGDSGGVVAGGGTAILRELAGLISAHLTYNNHMIYSQAFYITSELGVGVY